MRTRPYISEEQKKKKRRRIFFLTSGIIFATCLVLIGVFWITFRSPIFRLGSITVQGNSTVPAESIIDLLKGSALRDHNIFRSLLTFKNMLLWPDELTPDDMKFIPQLKSVAIDKNFITHTITVTASERNPAGIWCVTAEDQCFWFDDEGIAFGRAFDAEGNLIFTVHDHSQAKIGVNGMVLPERFTGNFISIVKVLHASGLAVKDIVLNDLAREEMTVFTANGPQLYFSLRFPADNTLPVIKDIMGRPGFSKLQYIDCRTENRVYYK